METPAHRKDKDNDMGKQDSAQKTINTIRRKVRRKYSTEEKIRIVMEGLKGRGMIADLCRREGISESVYYSWSKQFPEAGKERLAGTTHRGGLPLPDA